VVGRPLSPAVVARPVKGSPCGVRTLVQTRATVSLPAVAPNRAA